ncbi:hypothetical protein EHYA_06039 [Embleya hyalina]|uniref:Uncharacterized protein n=1 Tax=Embleya hyalina TaxID=516124 RepID=A0A401YUN5_9ACTN|nr:hypothetical protein EHYA_06039 [Embleya hyalina]
MVEPSHGRSPGGGFNELPQSSRSEMTLSIRRIDQDGTRELIAHTRVFGSASAPWPWGDGAPRNEPPCACSANCRYLHTDY